MKPETCLGSDGREVVLIHFELDRKIVCMPNMLPKDMASSKERSAPHMRTGAAAGVTCPMCKKTKEWAEAPK